MKYSKYNVAIIGSGISGLFLANKLAQNKEFSDGIVIITKGELFSGSSSLAQGGIVSVIPELNIKDSIESHIKDTIDAGCGLNNISVVQYVSKQSSKVTQDLINFGVKFDENDKHQLNFTLEGAHSYPRILHAQGDSTGRVIEEALCKQLEKANNVDLYDNTMALELLVDDDNSIKGVIVYNWQNDTYEVIYTSNIVIATGGIGQIYKNTTNPIESTADGIALAFKAGAEVKDMEFVQFHPTALYVKNKKTSPLVSESVRGEGAKLVNKNGEYFAKNYHYLAGFLSQNDSSDEKSWSRKAIRINKIQKIQVWKSFRGIESEKITNLKNLIAKRGIQYLSDGNVQKIFRVQFTKSGIKKYKSMQHMRPMYCKIEKEGDYTILEFNCSE